MKKLITICLLVLSASAIKAQNADFSKITKSLQEELKGKQFLGGMYDKPCYNIEKISVLESGEISIEGEEGGCTKTFLIKEAQISKTHPKVKIYQENPRINITFYTENSDNVYKLLIELKGILNKS